MCLAQGHNTVTPVRLEPAPPRSRVMHSTTEPLCSHKNCQMCVMDFFSYQRITLILIGRFAIQLGCLFDIYLLDTLSLYD